jgi:hypothetical protein
MVTDRTYERDAILLRRVLPMAMKLAEGVQERHREKPNGFCTRCMWKWPCRDADAAEAFLTEMGQPW